MSRKCQRCKKGEAEWAVQYIVEDKPSISRLGWHYRGFPVLAVCEACKEAIIEEAKQRQ